MSQSKVIVNGQFAGEWAYGYNSSRIDITPSVKFGAANTIAVRLDNPADSTRWYPGGGIYRHVWLVKANPVHIAYNGIFAWSENITPESAEVAVTTGIQGKADGISIQYALLDGSGKPVATTAANASVTRLKVKSPTLWNTENPYLYTLRTTLLRGEEKLDSEETKIASAMATPPTSNPCKATPSRHSTASAR